VPESFISAVRGYLRLGNFPLDASSVFSTLAEAEAYAESNSTAYPGQIVAVVNSTSRTVTLFQLGYKSNPALTGLELEAITTNGQGASVKSVNGVLPDNNGNVTITIEKLDEILTFLSDSPTKVTFNKPVFVNDQEVATKNYVQGWIDVAIDGVTRTFSTQFTHTGGTTNTFIPGTALIKRAVVVVDTPFNQCSITISVNGVTLFSPTEVYETEAGVYIAEPNAILPGLASDEYPVVIAVTGGTVGSARLYIDFNVDFTQQL
jgi:hypothetical protein